MKKQLFPGPAEQPTWEGLKARQTDTSGVTVSRTMNLSTPIVSVQDGPRSTMSLNNFGGKKATPFGKGKKRRSKVLAAKAAMSPAVRAAMARKRGE